MEEFGEIENIEMSKTFFGHNKGYCFITYKDKESVQKANKSGNHWLNGRLLSIRPMRLGKDLEIKLINTRENRVTVYGFPYKPNDL